MTTPAGGRPKFEITPEVCKKAESLAAQGLTLAQIARVLGICYDTLNERRKEYSEFSEAIETGKAKGIAAVTNSMFNKAKAGDTQAAKYFLNNRDNANWSERKELNVGGQDGNPIQLAEVRRTIVDSGNKDS